MGYATHMRNVVTIVLTCCILAFCGEALRQSLVAGHWWALAPCWGAILVGVYAMGQPEDRAMLRRLILPWSRPR